MEKKWNCLEKRKLIKKEGIFSDKRGIESGRILLKDEEKIKEHKWNCIESNE